MPYQVHKLEVRKETAQEKLQQFLGTLRGRVVSVVPYVVPSFQFMGATSKVSFLLIVEETR